MGKDDNVNVASIVNNENFKNSLKPVDDVMNASIVNFEMSVEVSGVDKTSFTFSKLPEIVGSGCPYFVQIKAVTTSPREVNTSFAVS
jgi:hypothetical protein